MEKAARWMRDWKMYSTKGMREILRLTYDEWRTILHEKSTATAIDALIHYQTLTNGTDTPTRKTFVNPLLSTD